MQCNVNDSAKHNVSMDFLKVIATILVVRLPVTVPFVLPIPTIWLGVPYRFFLWLMEPSY